jgi:alkanesulfonate monooxygenase SsuD/methylene tetrahydromethanopterin reductase-like flavin-dependent oxidoreductase (luciferase family)
MKLGFLLPNFGQYSDVRLLADLAHDADDAGWDGFFLADTIQMVGYETSPSSDPWIAMTAIVMRTERIRTGLIVSAPPRRRPWQFAKEAATLDQLSGGRLILGVGSGDEHDRAFELFGEERDLKRRAAMLDESLEIFQGLWSGKPYSFEGEHYQIKEITMLPVPVQQPRIPIWVGWLWPRKRPIDRAARWDGAVPYAMHEDGSFADISPDDLRRMRQLIDERRTADGPYDIVASGPNLEALTDSRAREALREYADAGATWTFQYIPPEFDVDVFRNALRQGPPHLG